MIPELQAEADRLNDDQSLHDPTAYYQGTHIGVRFDENPVMERLANLPQARAAAEAIGMGDMNHGGGMIVLTKEAAGKKAAAPLYWHHVRRFVLPLLGSGSLNRLRCLQDGSLWNDPLCCTPWPQTIFFNYYLEDASIEGGCLKVMCAQQRPRADSLSPC